MGNIDQDKLDALNQSRRDDILVFSSVFKTDPTSFAEVIDDFSWIGQMVPWCDVWAGVSVGRFHARAPSYEIWADIAGLGTPVIGLITTTRRNSEELVVRVYAAQFAPVDGIDMRPVVPSVKRIAQHLAEFFGVGEAQAIQDASTRKRQRNQNLIDRAHEFKRIKDANPDGLSYADVARKANLSGYSDANAYTVKNDYKVNGWHWTPKKRLMG